VAGAGATNQTPPRCSSGAQRAAAASDLRIKTNTCIYPMFLLAPMSSTRLSWTSTTLGYYFYNRSEGKVFVARNDVFLEKEFLERENCRQKVYLEKKFKMSRLGKISQLMLM
jgi:hypothetical protein